MKLSKLVGERFKEQPADCAIESHSLLVRGGYVKYVAGGIFSVATPLRRITRKIEQILREEMDAVDGQEVRFPVVMPASLWKESGRYFAIEDELVRFKDRNKTDYVLGMTHEEAAVHLVREHGRTHAAYPFMVYQIQTKFRDEARPKGGLIRVREFTMKDAYSFHTSQKDLEGYYQKCLAAYKRIFARAGVPEVIAVESDSGMMGGDVSHEFMLLSKVGEDSIALCGDCGFSANLEATQNITTLARDKVSAPMERVHTPGFKTIDEVRGFLNVPKEKCCKAVAYQKAADGALIVVFLRGDLELSEQKLKKQVGCDVIPAALTEQSGLCAGYIGPQGLANHSNLTVLFDNSLQNENNLVCGANEQEYHYTGLDITRDVPSAQFCDLSKAFDGGVCPACKKPSLRIERGIEVGNIFQLGTKYTAAMGMRYADAEGKEQVPIMGCYGIGVGRLAASVCQVRHDEFGPVWPMSIAPWQVHICALRSDNAAVSAAANKLYNTLNKAGIEVIIDDRTDVSAGVMFSDADLLGVPVRVIISPKTVERGVVEVKLRSGEFASDYHAAVSGKNKNSEDITASVAAKEIKKLVTRLKNGL
ncbi:MAG: proline--tRNA ligase [Firmicutes bacterium]|nr:proline--tRNA ligase [Bacillota bacterium]